MKWIDEIEEWLIMCIMSVEADFCICNSTKMRISHNAQKAEKEKMKMLVGY